MACSLLRIASYPQPQYNPSNECIGKLYVSTLADEWKGVRESFICSCYSLKKHETFCAYDICWRTEQRLQCGMKGDFIALVTDAMKETLKNVWLHDKTNFGTKTHIFNSLLCEATRYIMNKNISGILQPDEKDRKTGQLVIETLHDKHTVLHQPNLDNIYCKLFEQYE